MRIVLDLNSKDPTDAMFIKWLEAQHAKGNSNVDAIIYGLWATLCKDMPDEAREVIRPIDEANKAGKFAIPQVPDSLPDDVG